MNKNAILNLKRIPGDPQKFHSYINQTDDCQAAVDTAGFTIYPVDENGKSDFTDKEKQKHIVNEPVYRRWNWTDEESRKWSWFRKEFNDVYQKYFSADDAQKIQLEKQMHRQIDDCIEFDEEHHLIERVANGTHSSKLHLKTFGIKQDVLEYKTPLRTIAFNYEKEQPLNDLENDFIKKYAALHERAYELKERIKKLRSKIKEERDRLPQLWEQIPVLKDKADKASNTIYLPPPAMKGSPSEIQGFYVPTHEENRKNADDFNQHHASFYKDATSMCGRADKLYDELIWAENIFDEKDEFITPLFNETEELLGRLFHNPGGSSEVMSVDDEHEQFLGSWSDISNECDAASDDWETFVNEQSLFINVYNILGEFIREKFEDEDDSELPGKTTAQSSTDDAAYDTDDLRAETISRYESDLKLNTNTYFDTVDWHIILDNYQQKYDNKNKALAFERAMEQHPDDATLLIRKAGDLSDEHQYQKALEHMKRAEQQGPPHHPNLFYIKANIYCQLQTPERAIPLYEKLTRQEGKELKWWRTNSYLNLIDIYEKKKDYEQCIRLCKELIAEEPDDEYHCSNLAIFYNLSGNPEEAEQLLKTFLEKHPESPVCTERLGHVYSGMKQYDKAIEFFDRCFLTDKSEHYEAINHKGKALMELKRYKDAAVCFELCLMYFKPGKDYHLNAARCYEKESVPHQAIYHYRKALALDPDCSEALDALELLKEQMKKVTE